jgi:hypothetical protein
MTANSEAGAIMLIPGQRIKHTQYIANQVIVLTEQEARKLVLMSELWTLPKYSQLTDSYGDLWNLMESCLVQKASNIAIKGRLPEKGGTSWLQLATLVGLGAFLWWVACNSMG